MPRAFSPLLLLLIATGASGTAAAIESIGGKESPRAARSVHLQWSAPGAPAYFLATGGATTRESELGAPLPHLPATGTPPGELPAAIWQSTAALPPK